MSGFDPFPARRRAVSTVVLATCGLCAQVHAHATVETSTLAGIPLTKTVHSMRDLRYRHIVRRQFDGSRGAAARATLLGFGCGIDIPETDLTRQMMVFSTPEIVVKNGFSMPGRKKFVETIGLQGRGFRVNTDARAGGGQPVAIDVVSQVTQMAADRNAGIASQFIAPRNAHQAGAIAQLQALQNTVNARR